MLLNAVAIISPLAMLCIAGPTIRAETPERNEIVASSDMIKRDDPAPVSIGADLPITTTQFKFSDQMIYWGCSIDPAATLNNLASLCSDDSCDTQKTWTQQVEYITPKDGAAVQDILTISTPQAQYPNWFRNGMIAAVQQAVNKTVTSTEVHWTEYGPTPYKGVPQPIKRSCTVKQAPSEIQVDFRNGNIGIAHIDIAVSLQQIGGGFCSGRIGGAADFATSLAGAFDSPISDLLGAVKAICSMEMGGD